jgi:type III secretion protein C
LTQTRLRGRWLWMVALLWMLALSAVAQTWSNKRFVYRAENRELADVLLDFAASQSIPVAIDPQVKGRVSANFDTPPEDFLWTISKAYGLIWYHDGTTLFVYPSSAMQSRLFRLQSTNPTRVSSLMKSLNVGDARYPLRFNPAEKTLLANGPPRHIEIVASVVESLEQGVRDDGSGTVRVIALRHAVAADRRFGDSEVTGVVTLLTQLYNKPSQANAQASDPEKSLPLDLRAVDPVAPTSLERIYGTKTPGASAKSLRNKSTMFVPSPLGRSGSDAELSFQADEATNAVVIHGPAARMAQVEEVIRQLDRPQTMIEIEAAVIDVATDELESLGIQWRVSGSGGSVISVAPAATTPSIASVIPLAEGATNITTLINDAGRQFLASVRALEGKGKARIVSRPKVLGSENRLATMVDKRIASVRVAGNLDAKLFTIEAGTTLQVMPQIVPGDAPRQVKLTLYIQDGNFEGAAVDQVPIIKRTEINTEASIREGESLLIGGISVETEVKGRSGVPGLSRIPLLGALFRVDDASSSRRERLFLLTPKIVGSTYSTEPAKPVSMRQQLAPVATAVPVPVAEIIAANDAATRVDTAALPPAAAIDLTRAANTGADNTPHQRVDPSVSRTGKRTPLKGVRL